MKRFDRGLVVGKFSPLHRGHESLVAAALSQCREVVLLSYTSPEYPRCEPGRRLQWLNELFPLARSLVLDGQRDVFPPNDAGAGIHHAFIAGILADRIGAPVDAVFTSEEYGEAFARDLTRLQRSGWPGAPTVSHVMFDRQRAAVPISATRIRSDPWAHDDWLSAPVRAAYVERICLLGGESSGKSTLAEALGRALGEPVVGEYGRELWEEKRGALTYEDHLAIGLEQVRREEVALRRARRYVVCDTSPLTTCFYSWETFGRCDPGLEALGGRRYEHLFVCDRDFPFVQDGTRRDAAFRERGQAWHEAELDKRGWTWVRLSGDVAARLSRVLAALGPTSCPTSPSAS